LPISFTSINFHLDGDDCVHGSSAPDLYKNVDPITLSENPDRVAIANTECGNCPGMTIY